MTTCPHTKASSHSARALMCFTFQGSKCYDCGALLHFNRSQHVKAIALLFGAPALLALLVQSHYAYAILCPVAGIILAGWAQKSELEVVHATDKQGMQKSPRG